MENELNLKLEVFSGPLDLLLHLIKKLEIDIYDIPIATITEQYMRYINEMQEHQLEIAGEYIVMASTLMAIKSKMLIPITEVEMEDELLEYEDPRAELVQQLLIYKQIQEAADWLDHEQEQALAYYGKEATDLSEYQNETISLPKGIIKLADLKEVMEQALQKMNEETPAVIKSDKETIQEAAEMLQERMLVVQKTSFTRLFTKYQRSDVVVTFLAMLELIKQDQIVVRQEHMYEDIYLEIKENSK